MLNNRGYVIVEQYDNKLLAENYEDKKIFVLVSDEEKVNMNTIKELIVIMNEHHFEHAILIYKDVITPSARKILETLPTCEIELFSIHELQYNLIEHVLVPPHEKVEDGEAAELRKKYGTKLPTILKGDAVCRYYNFQRGDILRVTRPTEIVYRVVR